MTPDEAEAARAAQRAELEAERDRVEHGAVEDFAAFWDSQQRDDGKVLRNVYGTDLWLPGSLPLAVQAEAERLQESETWADTRRLVGILFDLDDAVIDGWAEQGMDLEQLQVLILWGMRNLSGEDTSLAQAREEYRRRDEGKAQPLANRADRRAGRTRGGSPGSTGPLSRRTSPANTG